MSGKHFIDKKPESMLDWIAIVCAGIAFYLLLNNLGYFLGGFGALMGILSPFFGGIVIAYILDPMVRFFHAKLLKYSKRWRWVAILLAYLVAVLLIVLLAWLVIPQIVNSIMTLFNNVPQYINGIQEMLLFVQGRYGVDLDRAIKMLDDSEAMLNEVYSLGKTVLPQIMSTMGNVAGNFVNVFTAIASSIYMLADKRAPAAPAAHRDPRAAAPAVRPSRRCASATMPTITSPVSSSARSSTPPSSALLPLSV